MRKSELCCCNKVVVCSSDVRCILTMCIINGTDNQFNVNDVQTLVGAIQNPNKRISETKTRPLRSRPVQPVCKFLLLRGDNIQVFTFFFFLKPTLALKYFLLTM